MVFICNSTIKVMKVMFLRRTQWEILQSQRMEGLLLPRLMWEHYFLLTEQLRVDRRYLIMTSLVLVILFQRESLVIQDEGTGAYVQPTTGYLGLRSQMGKFSMEHFCNENLL